MDIEFLKMEISRGYDVLGKERGNLQNYFDIIGWFKSGIITKDEKKRLDNFNSLIYSALS